MRPAGEEDGPDSRQTRVEGDDDGGADEPEPAPPARAPFDRRTLVIADEKAVMLPEETGFSQAVAHTFLPAESLALEETVELKQRLREASDWDFWQLLVEGLTQTMDAQYAFVAKRVLHDDEDSAVEMPPLGEPGSCLMGLAFYFNDHKGQTGMFRNYKYKVYGAPCQWMRHDKVLVIPGSLSVLTPDNPNAHVLPLPPEGYMAVPLFHEGKCFAHFGVMFSSEALERRKLGWGALEMFLHALEDQVCQKIVGGLGLAKPNGVERVMPQQVASTATPPLAMAHSLRPYARRLSHELRTPMQGVVGMLDVMYASVLEASEAARWEWPDMKQLKHIIDGLRASIEVAQDSSKRAVDAADNMVHAYDFDMQVPGTPFQEKKDFVLRPPEQMMKVLPAAPTPAALTGISRSSKRRRDSNEVGENGLPHKMVHLDSGPAEGTILPYKPAGPGKAVVYPHGNQPSPELPPSDITTPQTSASESLTVPSSGYFPPQNNASGSPLSFDYAGKVQLSSRPVRLRELLHQVVHESLRSGGRPDYTQSVETERGEQIFVETRASDGVGAEETSVVEIITSVEEGVPDIMIADSIALTKLLSSVFHNSVKFTLQGRISITVMTTELRQILFTVTDTGTGIPTDFMPDLFKAFSREDVSLTRHRDGLGLGLMVAKGIARKMGGDLWCERTSTEGHSQGTEFRVRLPITPGDAPGLSTPTPSPTPMLTPTPTPNDIPPETLLAGLLNRRTSPPVLPTPIVPSETCMPVKKRNRRALPFDPELGKKLPLRILVVEDNRINRNLLCSMLNRLGYTEIEEARDGVEAVETFSSGLTYQQKWFDLVLMDLWMPRLDGFEATEQILGMVDDKGGGRAGDVTVLAVSADATEAARIKAAEKGIRGFVGKPFGMVELGKALWEYCGQGRALLP